MKNQKRVPVRSGLGHAGCPDRAAGSHRVFDHEVAARDGLFQRFGQVSGHPVGRPRGKGHNDGDWLVAGVGLGLDAQGR